MDANKLAAALEQLLSDEEAWREVHAVQINQLKQEASTPAERIVEYIASKVII